MKKQYCKLIIIFCWIWTSLFFTRGHAQTCPANIDFELGNFTNWEFYSGVVTVVNGLNTINWLSISSTPPRMNNVEMILPTDVTTDPIGNFPRHCPNGSGYSIKLGNNQTGAQADGISYTYAIPANLTKFSILYQYAIVLESPNHTAEQQPRFRARIIDVASNQEVNCVSFDFTASASLPGFNSAGGIVYKDWTPVSVDLSSYIGKTIRLELIASDCTQGGHYGYAYIDVNSECDGNIEGSTYCQGDTALTLTAPYGYQSYQWYADATFSQLLNTTQSISLNTSTNPGTVFPVVVNPYPTFGCLDTLYAVILSGNKPVSKAGADQLVCSKQAVQLGAPPDTGVRYAWLPAGLLQNATVAAPFTKPPLNAPAKFVVKTTAIATGCFSYDTVLVTPKFVDTATGFSGSLAYCPGDPLQTILTISNPNVGVQWQKENIPLAGSTGLTFQPATIGNYRAQIQQDGCTDTSRVYTIRYTAVPKAGFDIERTMYCLHMPAGFKNTSTIGSNEAMTYLWRFSDGSMQQNVNVVKTFTTAGVQPVTLVVTSANNCVDSLVKTVTISSVCDPLVPSAFTPNGDGRNERLTPFMGGAKELKKFVVYDRFGGIVFSTATEGTGWNGGYNGVLAQSGVYVWILEYVDADGRFSSRKGTVMLIR